MGTMQHPISHQARRESLRLYALDLAAPVAVVPADIPVTIRTYHRPVAICNVSPATLRDRIKQGNVVFLAWHRTQQVAHLFATTHRCWVGEIEDDLIPARSEVYFYDTYTAPAYRRKHICAYLLTRAARFYRRRSYRSCLIFVTEKNSASIAAIERAGFRHYQTVEFRCMSAWRQWHYNSSNGNVTSRFENEV